MKKLEQAIQVATSLHSGQYRWDGKPYIIHPLSVMQRLINKWVNDETTLCCAVLHDVLEDTDVTEDFLLKMFWQNVLNVLQLLTHNKNVPYEEYIDKIKEDVIARQVKLADIEDNSFIGWCVHSWSGDDKIMRRHLKYVKAYRILLNNN